MTSDTTRLPAAGSTGRRPGVLPRLVPYLAIVAAANTLIAAMLTAARQGEGFLWNFAYSQSIGLLILLLVVPVKLRWRGRRIPAWLSALHLALAVVVGFVGGRQLAAWILGAPVMIGRGADADGLLLPVLVTLLASAGCIGFFWQRERVASLAADAAAQRERAEAERARAETASRQATEAELNLIRTQLEPHMLFNTLANLRSLMEIDPRRAQLMVDHLIGFLRATLAASRSGSVALRDEFAVARDYLALMEIRMGDRLRHSLELPEALAGVTVLPMLLQPLVENAVRHGIEPAIEGGRIDVSARVQDGMLAVSVADSGLGFDPSRRPAGFGLGQVRERLATAYGDRAALQVESPRSDGLPGTRVTVVMPLEPIA
jgi:signal transduction histidine kinase